MQRILNRIPRRQENAVAAQVSLDILLSSVCVPLLPLFAA